MTSPLQNAKAAKEPKYRAFICYSQQDRVAAERLHRRLENYRVPKHLVGRETAIGRVPSGLSPIFRDCDELAASSDIGADLRGAIRESQFLIVLCSQAATQSRWVNAEIEIFRTHHPENERRILCAILSGEPETECFPPALHDLASDAAMPHFPLAADFRPGRERREDAELRLIAALLGVSFDELKRREHTQRVRRLRRALVAAAILALTFAALTVFAFVQRGRAQKAAAHATRARDEAEKLVDFMVFGLRSRLEAIGKLSLLEPANEKVRRYYETVAPEEENAELLYRRNTALIQHGDDLFAKGDIKGAVEFYETARKICEHETNLQMEKVPWRHELAAIHSRLASAAGTQNNLTTAMVEDTAGLSILQDLAHADSENVELQHEIALATTRLGSLHRQKGETAEAENKFRSAISILDRITNKDAPPGWTLDTIYTLNELGETLRKTGKKSEAEADLRRAISINEELLAHDSDNVRALERLELSHNRLSQLLGEASQNDQALEQRRLSLKISRQLTDNDPDNVPRQRDLSNCCLLMDELLGQLNRYAEAEPYVIEALDITKRLVAQHPSDKSCLADLPQCLNHLVDLYLHAGKREDALQVNKEAIEVRRKICAQDPANKEMKHWLAYDIHCLGVALMDLKRPHEAEQCAHEAIQIDNELVSFDPANLVPLQFRALYELELANALRDEKRASEAKDAYLTCLHSVSLYVEKGGLPQSVHYPREEAEKALQKLHSKTASK